MNVLLDEDEILSKASILPVSVTIIRFIIFLIIVGIGVLPAPSLADETMGGVYKASVLVGKVVKSPEGKDLGVIEEIVITTTGEVAYAVLSFGGFLGMGDKLFAIPWVTLSHSPHGEYLVLDVQAEKLAQAPGFEKNAWPDMKDKNWKSKIWDFYHVSAAKPAEKSPATK